MATAVIRASKSHVPAGVSTLLAAWACLGMLGCGGATSPGRPLREPIFVAVGAEGTILTSPDAASWRSERSGVSAALTSVAASGTQFVAVGSDGTILTSQNGRVWTAQSSGTRVDLAHVIFNGEQFIAVGGEWSDQGVALTSIDGVAWKGHEAPARYSFHAVAAVGGTIFASAETPHPTLPMALDNVVLASVLPSTSNRGGWIERDLPRFADSVTLAGETQGETFTVGSWNGESTLSRSQDSEEWTTQALPVDDAHAIAVGPGDLGFVIVGSSSALTSLDGSDWLDNPPPVRSGSWLMDVAAGKSGFAAVGLHGTIFTLGSDFEWTPRPSGVATALYDVTFGPLE
jgi:hypothetical protein